MLQKTFLLISVFFLSISLNAQHFTWAKKYGNSIYDNGKGISNDASGNIYVAGNFFETDSTGFNFVKNVQGINKYDSSGYLIWSKIIDSAGVVNGICTDGSGNSYTTGSSLIKIDSSGNIVWIKKPVKKKYFEGRSIAIDKEGFLYFTGQFYDTLSLDGQDELVSISSSRDIFIAKYDSSGNLIWSIKEGGIFDDIGNGIGVDKAGNVFITGATLMSANYYNSDILLAKYNSLGGFIWKNYAGGTKGDESNALAVDGEGNCYITGAFKDTATFGNITIMDSLEGCDAFTAKYDAEGNIAWVKYGGGTIGCESGNGIAIDKEENIYVTGDHCNGVVFDNFILNGFYDAFIVKYDKYGNLIWAKEGGGYESVDKSKAICIDNGGNLLITGMSWMESSFDEILLNDTTKSFFIGKLIQENANTVASISRSSKNIFNVSVYPNPFVDGTNFTISGISSYASLVLTILNFDGKIVYENALSGSSEELHYYLNKNELTSGMYFYKISSGEEVYSGKIVIE